MGFILHSSLCGAIIQRVAETMFITYQCFSCCWTKLAQHQGFFSFPFCPSCPSSKLAGGGYRVWMGSSQDSWLQVTKRIFHITWCSAIKAQVKEEQGRTFMVMIFVFPNNCYTWWSLACQERLNICLLVGRSEWISYFALPAHVEFAFPI